MTVNRTLRQKICEYCGKTYETWRGQQLYCSRGCNAKASTQKKLQAASRNGRIDTWACGCGVQSTAIAALIVQGILHKPTWSYTVDAGYEKEATLQYRDNVLIPELAKVGIKLHIIPSGPNPIIVDERCVIPAYTRNSDNKVIRLRTRCGSWKMPVAKRWLRKHGVKWCHNWVGISLDEQHRIRKSQHRWCKNHYPLIKLRITRNDCKRIIKKIGWPMPQRTSCYFCPQQSRADWINLKHTDSADWQRAVEIDRMLNKRGIFLHELLKPLDCIVNDEGGRFSFL